MPTIQDRVKDRMADLGWVHGDGTPIVKKLQERSGLSYATAHALVNGTHIPTLATLEKAATRLRTTPQWLAGHDDDFDLRAYLLGRQHAVEVVRQALDDAVSASVPTSKASGAPAASRKANTPRTPGRKKPGKGGA